ncbi:MAG: hypothetical protein IPJ71_19795 [Bdellovibrionales bacterium]|nr:hypothetical protein [Bdellovibrionales bacterium]
MPASGGSPRHQRMSQHGSTTTRLQEMEQNKADEKNRCAFQIYGLDVKFRKWDNGFLVTRIDKMRNEESRAIM